MTTKITYEFEATADNAQLLVDINNLIARNVLAIETAATLTTMMEKPTPVTEEDKAAILTALGEEPGQPEPEQYYSEPEIDIPVLTAESVIPEPEPEPVAPAAALSETTEPEEDTPDISPHLAYNDVKEAARDAKKTHGDAFAKQVLTDHDCDIKTTLGRSLTGIPEEKYQSIVQAWVKGPVKSTSMFEEEKEDGPVSAPEPEEAALAEETRKEEEVDAPKAETEEEPVDQPDIEPEAVKMALRAYAKKHTKEAAKALMAEFDIPSLPAVSNADQATLTALFTKVL